MFGDDRFSDENNMCSFGDDRFPDEKHSCSFGDERFSDGDMQFRRRCSWDVHLILDRDISEDEF